jgi:predicted rRNA methylase YqxC with S4 and FtsJ domains
MQNINQISDQSMQAKNVNINAMDVFLAFTMVQQIMTELSGAMTEKEKVAVITKAVFRLLKNNASDGSQPSENHSIQC